MSRARVGSVMTEKKSETSVQTVYRRNPSIEVSAMKDESLLFDPGTNRFCLLNETAAVVWNRLAQPMTAGQLVEAVCEAFDGVERSRARSDVENLLRQLSELAFVSID
jgi:hypothetical protein